MDFLLFLNKTSIAHLQEPHEHHQPDTILVCLNLLLQMLGCNLLQNQMFRQIFHVQNVGGGTGGFGPLEVFTIGIKGSLLIFC